MHLGCRIHRIGRRQRRLPAVFNVARKLPEVTLAMTLLFAVLSIFPIIDVKDALSFTVKVSGVVIAINALGALYFWRANNRRKALTAA
jgi:hypothetical protein